MEPRPIALHMSVEAGVETAGAQSVAGNAAGGIRVRILIRGVQRDQTFPQLLFRVERLEDGPLAAGSAQPAPDAQRRVEANALKVEPKLADDLRVGKVVHFRRVSFVAADEIVMRVGGGRVDDGPASMDEDENLVFLFELWKGDGKTERGREGEIERERNRLLLRSK